MNEIKKKRDEKLLKRIEKGGIVSDRSFNLIFNDPAKLTITGNFNYQTKMVHDLYSDFLFREKALKLPRLEEEMFNPKDAADIQHNIETYRAIVPQVSFSDSDFRRILGVRGDIYTNQKIYELVRDYAFLKIEGEVYSYWSESESHWHTVEIIGSLVNVAVDRPKRITGNYPEHVYHFSMNLGGMFHFQNFCFHQIALLPQRFYQMRVRGSQDLFRYLVQFSQRNLTLKEVSQILGYTETRNEERRVKHIVKCLKEIKDNGLLSRKGYEVTGSGKETEFKIIRYHVPQAIKRAGLERLFLEKREAEMIQEGEEIMKEIG